MERETLAVEVCNATAIPGNAGKYISMAKGLMVERAPRMRMIRIRFGLGLDTIFGRLLTMKIGVETPDEQMASLRMNRNGAVRRAGHRTEQDLTHSTSAQSLSPIFHVKIQFKSFPGTGAVAERISHRVAIRS